MSKKTGLALASLLAAAALSLTACTGGATEVTDADQQSGKGQSVAMSFPGMDIAIWPALQDMMRPIVEESGYSLITHDPGWDIQRQVEDWEAWIARGDVKAIMGYPVQTDTIYAVTEDAVGSGIPVLGYASNWEGTSAALIYNNYDDGFVLGEAAGEWILENHGADSVMPVGILGFYDSELGRDRTQGIMDGLESTGANVDMTEHAVNDLDDGYEAVQNQLTAAPDTKVFLSFSNDSAAGAYQALLDEGVDPSDQSYLLGNLDVVNELLDTVKGFEGFWSIVYSLRATDAAAGMASLLVDAANGDDVTDIIIPVERVTDENLDSFRY